MVDIEPWDIWHSKALAAGVGATLASLSRAVIHDYRQHGRDHDECAGEGAFLDADRHHAMMIALAKQKPELAKAFFAEALAFAPPKKKRKRLPTRQKNCMPTTTLSATRRSATSTATQMAACEYCMGSSHSRQAQE